MWADAQRDGHPAEYRWHPLQEFRNSIPCTTPQSLADVAGGVPCINTANIGERRPRRKVNFARGKIPSGGKSPQKCIYRVTAQETAKHHVKFR